MVLGFKFLGLLLLQEGTVVLHGVYPPTTNSTEVSSEFLLEMLQTYNEERVAEKSKIEAW